MTIKEIAKNLGVPEYRVRHILVCLIDKKKIKNSELDYTIIGKYRCLNLSPHQAGLIKAEHLRLKDNPANVKWTNEDYLDFLQVNFGTDVFSIREVALLSGKTVCRITIKLNTLSELGLLVKSKKGSYTRYYIKRNNITN